MIESRRNLQIELQRILGSSQVYFQPPENVRIQYPCFVYSFDNVDTRFGNDKIYKAMDRYTITHIYGRVSDANLVDDVLSLPYASFDRSYVSDSLYHDVYTIYVLHE